MGSDGHIEIKCEPEIQIVECDPPPPSSSSSSSPSPHHGFQQQPQHGQASDEDAAMTGIGVDPTVSCVASGHGSHTCRGELLNLNKLTSYLDLVTKQVSSDSGTSAMERAIIKSRLRVPFWKADEGPIFICDHHRYDLVHNQESLTTCTICHKKRSKKPSSQQALMMTITYRISLENYTKSGNILPIGLLVCSHCKDKHLKGVDFSNSQIAPYIDKQQQQQQQQQLSFIRTGATGSAGAVSITTIGQKRKAEPTNSPGQAFQWSLGAGVSAAATNGVTISRANPVFGGGATGGSERVQVIVQSVPKPQLQQQQQAKNSTTITPSSPATLSLSLTPTPKSLTSTSTLTSSSQTPAVSSPVSVAQTRPSPSPGVGVTSNKQTELSSENIFTKISRLNEALHAINPRYKPIGFSITSIESCSQSVLEDAVVATETAVSTLMSVIAPGQEAYLWEAIKPKLDSKLGTSSPSSPSPSSASKEAYQWALPEVSDNGDHKSNRGRNNSRSEDGQPTEQS